ncbi:MAG: class I SAM-dependent methyltransferase [Phaeodactylibacter sp.]|nr:class I SAM-dependent methyltransferase [Phaeodactylibacter sp.]MCB9052977.1 class I SAM-dependent methyltransferase [Lewinellaceae bacterium]
MDTLNQRIQHFYDRSTALWLDTWGEHMHHGYYGEDGKEQKDHTQAQVDLALELLRWGGVEKAGRILDAGCGVGGSARLLAQLYDAEVLACTLSPVQAEQGRKYNEAAGLEDKVEIRAQDMMSLSAAEGPFSLIWSMESAEHIREKQKLLDLFHGLLEPGGKLLMATWFHRPLPPELSSKEKQLLEGIYQYYHLPPMVSIPELEAMARASGFGQVETADWTNAVAPFWGAVMRSAFQWRSVKGLMKAGWPTLKGAWAMRYMIKGYRMGLIRFGVLQGQKI